MRKEILKKIKVAIVLFIITILVISCIVSQDEHHLDECHESHCGICNLIHIAQNIISLSIAIIIAIMIGVFIYFYLARINKEQIVLSQYSLVFQNVQLNE